MERAAGFFPNRAEFAFGASGGSKGKPPDRLARVLPYTGWLTMRSDWSPNALYMAVNFNGNPRSQAGHYDQLSFGLWAFGRPWMTNPGSTTSDGKEYTGWSGLTIGANTVMVDDVNQDRWDNSGRLESWEDLPGFTYSAAASWAYRGLGGTHRRAILFLRSQPSVVERSPDHSTQAVERPGDRSTTGRSPTGGYWLMVDRISGDGKPHDYCWLGHFQPTKLSIDPATKAIATAPKDGKRLWVIPARPDTFSLEQGSGPLITPQATGALPPSHPHRAIGPYVALRQKAVKGPASFAALLYPAADEGAAPLFESLPSDKASGARQPPGDAVGFRVRRGANDDLLVLAPGSDLRSFGSQKDGCVTDAEMAYVRRTRGQVTEGGLAAGRLLEIGGKTLIGLGPDIMAARVRYDGNTVEVSTRGRGEVRIARGPATRMILNGKVVRAEVVGDQFRAEAGTPGKIALTALDFATDPASRCKGIGVPLGYGGSYKGPEQSALIRFKSSVPSDMTIEWREAKETTWKRVANPEPIADHYYLLTDLEHGKTYQVRLTCRSPDGRVGNLQREYTFTDPDKAPPKPKAESQKGGAP